MTQERWQQVKQLVAEAQEMPAAERGAWLERAAAGDSEVLREAESLLAALDANDTSDPLEKPAAEAFSLPPKDSLEGQKAGPYRLQHRIGSGGMGDVYAAARDDDQFRKRVAIKLVRLAGQDPEPILYRFRTERQVLAAFDHPNIVKLLDAGTTASGVPYLVMDYVEGVPIDVYCDRNTLSISERLGLFLSVCRAVHYAHQNLVIHRDLKPGNILVTASGVPKLLDFGIAKLLNPGMGVDAALTRADSRPMTPMYASPEQLRGEPVTTASDVYALGVILYQLLTGHSPYGPRTQDSIGALEQAICHEQPERPSTVIEKAVTGPGGPGQTAEQISEAREGQIHKLRRRLSGDLDAIVLMALRKEPSKRYASAEHLAADIQRSLDGRPVLAHQGSFRYHAEKFVRRNAVLVAASTVFLVAIAAATTTAVFQARAASAARQRAEQRLQDVRKLARLVLFDFHDQIAKVPGAMEVQQSLINQTLGHFETLARESGGDPEILADLGEGYDRLGAILGNPYTNNRGDPDAAIATYRKGVTLLEGARGTSADLDAALGRLHRSLGRTLFSRGQSAEALAELEQAVVRFERAAKAKPSVVTETSLMNSRNTIGDFLIDTDPQRALGIYDANAEVLARIDRMDPTLRTNGILHYKRGACHELLGDLPKAVEMYRLALARTDDLPEKARATNDNRRARASILSVLGGGLAALGRGTEALPYLDESVAISRTLLAADPANSRAQFSLAVNLNNRNIGLHHLGMADALFAGQMEEEQAWQKLMEKSTVAAYQSAAAMNLDALSRSYAAKGDTQRARDYARRSLDLFARVAAGAPSPEDRRRYADALLEGGAPELRNPRLALEQMEQAVRRSALPAVAVARTYGLALLRNGRAPEAAQQLERCLSRMRTGGVESRDVAQVRAWLREAQSAH